MNVNVSNPEITITIQVSSEEASVLRSVSGLAGYVTDRVAQEYGWNPKTKESVKEVLLDLYWKLTHGGVPHHGGK